MTGWPTWVLVMWAVLLPVALLSAMIMAIVARIRK